VAEKFLHNTKVCSTVQQVRRERVPQGVWVERRWKPCCASDCIKSSACTALAERAAIAVQEERSGRFALLQAYQLGTRIVDIAL
jgi:hypothetical protein